MLPDEIREQLLAHYDKVAGETTKMVEINAKNLESAIALGNAPAELGMDDEIPVQADPNELVPITDENFLASLATEVGLGMTGYKKLERSIRDNIDEFIGGVNLDDPDVTLDFIVHVELDTPLVDINSPALRNIAFVHKDTAWQVHDVNYMPVAFGTDTKQLWVELRLFSLADV